MWTINWVLIEWIVHPDQRSYNVGKRLVEGHPEILSGGKKQML